MATRKKTNSDPLTARGEEMAAVAPKLTRTRKAAAPEGTVASEQKTATPKSSAATHKAPARKALAAVAGVDSPVEAVVVETTTFDISLHHAEISTEAYYHWLRRGCPQGSEHDDWLAAIEVVRARHRK